MTITQNIATLLLRFALAAGFLSAVASRLDLWGQRSSGWTNFVAYTAQVNAFAPASFARTLAIIATLLESGLAILLLIGFKTSAAAYGSCLLTLLFALAMAISSGVKEPLDYSVFAVSAGALLLGTIGHYAWSVDQLLTQ
ncbi:DoxX protein [Chitinophaga sp. sic0106]|uniref:DoxX protein n=1 Tax=Chitinophaga sp. sic0106 TaxID=2854785 RepID=UPI001C485EA1|nr:DoxX protein [Chitinophaga sp. sic0106]MBV7532095.1 DoxX protein [Chitinophaga sp. sic0106]